jgi:hypothetical protein
LQNIIEIIEYENESHRVDFKMIEYSLGRDPKKNEILKDISAFANHLSDSEKFIIIGIKELEDKTKEIIGIDNPTDEAKYRQFINDNIEPPVNFEYQHFIYNEKTISFFRLFENNNRPYLFKKDAKNPLDGKTIFKYGDGFIRVGTSTKKIGRKELDDITENKNKHLNRQADIDILPVVGKYQEWGVKYLDLNISNRSNKSIDIDVEIIIKKSPAYEILLEEDFLREIEKNKYNAKKASSFAPIVTPINPVLSNIHIDAKENNNEFIVARNPLKHKFAITLAQNSVDNDIFLKSIMILEDKSNVIDATVVIRSDDFTKGAITKNIQFTT